jgi:hypothetical protein
MAFAIFVSKWKGCAMGLHARFTEVPLIQCPLFGDSGDPPVHHCSNTSIKSENLLRTLLKGLE